eukprot:6202253-Pleurochrysis_carterae.AAC.3
METAEPCSTEALLTHLLVGIDVLSLSSLDCSKALFATYLIAAYWALRCEIRQYLNVATNCGLR